MNRKYNLKLDLQFRCNNSVMKFRQSDNKTSDFFMRITRGGELFNIDNAIVILVVIKPNQTAQSQFLEIKEGKIYADLNSNMKDQVGIYKAQALLIYEDERVSTDVIEYEVTEDNILNQLETTVRTTEEFTMLQQMLSRLSVIELSETSRANAELSREEAEKLREEAIEKIKSDTTKLISDTKKEISDYKSAKDTAINDDLSKYKEATTQSIDNYKSAKDTEINETLNEYKHSTTDDIEEFKNAKSRELDDFKNTKNSEIDDYKIEKDLAINQYVEDKNLQINNYIAAKDRELDEYKEAKDKEIDLYKSNKDTLINNKITEVEAAKQNMQNDVNSKIEEADTRISELQNFETQLDAIDSKNTEQDTRLKDIEYKNKLQDVKLEGLFNENNNGRLTIEGEGNSLKLEGSKKGLVTVDKVVGNTMVNLATIRKGSFNFHPNPSVGVNIPLLRKINTVFTVIINVKNHTLNYNCKIQLNCDDNVNIYPTGISSSTTGLTVFKIQPIKEGKFHNVHTIRFYTDNTTEGNFAFDDLIILEGDFTNKPIPQQYFEGMQSSFEENLVTQEMVDEGLELEENLGKYKYEVEVRGKNLIKNGNFTDGTNFWFCGSGTVIDTSRQLNGHNSIKLVSSESVVDTWKQVNQKFIHSPLTISKTYTASMWYYVEDKTTFDKNLVLEIKGQKVGTSSEGALGSYHASPASLVQGKWTKLSVTFTVDTNYDYVKIIGYIVRNGTVWLTDFQIEEGDIVSPYEPYYSQTKAVYLNSLLLKGDEIVYEDGELKHWHKMKRQRISDMNLADLSRYEENGLNQFYWDCLDVAHSDVEVNIICDKLKSILIQNRTNNYNTIYTHRYGIAVNIQLNSKAEFIAWVKSNILDIAYKLAEPWYETIDANGFLMEIPDNATISIKSVVPVQSVKATYTANIPSVYGLQETNNNQDNLIDISLCATDEMYMMIEPILEAMPKTININKRMVSKMVDMYVAMVIRGLKTIEEVPVRYRKEVQDILNKLEK